MSTAKWKDGSGHVHEYEVCSIRPMNEPGVGIYAKRAAGGWRRLGFGLSEPTGFPADMPSDSPPRDATHLHFRRIARREDRLAALEALRASCCCVP